MRGKKSACPNCGHEMNIPSYPDDDPRNSEAPHTVVTRRVSSSGKTSYSKSSASKMPEKSQNASFSMPSGRFFIGGIFLILVVLLVSMVVNILLLSCFTAVKAKLSEPKQEQTIALQEPVKIRAENRIPVIAVQPKWEYQIIRVKGTEKGSSPESMALDFPEQYIAETIAKYSADNWELTGVVPQVETVFPNLSRDALIPVIQPNTRTHSVILIFKRAKSK